MKKTVLGLAMVILGLGTTHLNAQGITGGVKAGVNISNFILSDMGSAESAMNAGANLGGFMKIDLSDHFAIQPELMFHFKSSDMEQAGFKDTYEYWGMDIPVYAMGQWTVQRDRRFFVGVGPYIGLGFSSKYKDLDTDLYEEVGGTAPMQRFDFGFGALAGFEFSNGIQINAGYKLGVVDALDAGKEDATMLPQVVSLGIGYRF